MEHGFAPIMTDSLRVACTDNRIGPKGEKTMFTGHWPVDLSIVRQYEGTDPRINRNDAT